MNHLRVETEDTFSSLLDLAANNDVEGVKLSINRDPSCVDEPGLWYGRRKGGSKTIMVNDLRTPLMVAATYGSIEVIKVIILSSTTNVNQTCGNDKTTALHCAASGGAVNVVQVVKLLLAAGADSNALDSDGQRACDVIVVPPKLQGVKVILQELLSSEFKNADPSLVYASDEFRMYSFKVRPCSRAYSHDWTECPFVHPGENARRRDPRKFHYSCVPCLDFKRGACRGGDMCEYAHGVFESWLHPAQYRTRLCKDGTGCARRVCFFAHTPDELRPLYSPRSNAGSSPSSSVVSPFSPLSWPQQPNVPALHLPGSNLLQSSRLRSSFNARDEFNMLSDYEQEQLFNEFSNSLSWSGRMKSLPPSNLDDLYSAEGSLSPRFTDSAVFSPTHKSVVFNQFQQQSMLSSPKNVDHSLFSGGGRMSPRNVVDPISPMSSRVSMLSPPNQFRSLSSRELRTNTSSVVGSPVNNNNNNSWWGSSNGEPDWGMSSEEAFGKLRSSSSFDGDEPDVSWVQSLVKESSK